MNFALLLPVVFSFLLAAAHFQRAGITILVFLCLCAPSLLLIARPWSVRIIQILLMLATLEWLRSLVELVQLRMEHGMPWVRLALILGIVSLLTASSIAVLQLPRFKKKYNFR